jgi:hypothetical protein
MRPRLEVIKKNASPHILTKCQISFRSFFLIHRQKYEPAKEGKLFLYDYRLNCFVNGFCSLGIIM